MLQLMHQG